ncbi:testis-expressed protein 2 isoform X3 [Zophobas morio]|uniref:testis-expressed protein 2 isoform X3 n=1 Tax=Zophobas morio TaxID=2755281 RepID=UPI003082B01E
MSKKTDGKITLGMLKGKPVTTSVPTISIKFHANAEQLEELYASDEEHTGNELSTASAGATGINEPDSSPLKYLPRLVKRSTSIDITPSSTIDASPPSDPWRFFSDIKGKITKSVEDKITEIKSRNQEEGSPLKGRIVKDSKDNSSVSDSEELSESSISKTCGIVSTTEGAEMSSDDDTPSIEKDKKTEDRAKLAASGGGLRQRFRLLKKTANKEGTVTRRNLTSLYNINTDKIEQALPEETEIESAVDALEDANLQTTAEDKVLTALEHDYDNIKLDAENVINIKEVSGSEVREVHWASKTPKTVFAPVGYVDFRVKPKPAKISVLRPVMVGVAFVVTYLLIHNYSTYLAGITIGVAVTVVVYYLKYLLDTPSYLTSFVPPPEILQVPAVQEFQPLTKYEGWVNEFPDTYNPHTYHISQTQSVYLRLQGNLLRVSHTRSKVAKRALWNEPKVKPVFTHHRIYNLLGAQVSLLPEGLAKKRHWSKKYPICVTLRKNQMQFETVVPQPPLPSKSDEDPEAQKPKRYVAVKKRRSQTLRFSKLSEENEEFDLDSETSRASTPSPLSQDDSEKAEEEKALDDAFQESTKDDEHEDVFDEDVEGLDDWGTFTPPEDDSPSTTKLYLFGRTDREKEDWFRRLKAATHRGAHLPVTPTTTVRAISHTLLDKAAKELDYAKYMLIFKKAKSYQKDKNDESGDELPCADVQWINAFVGRVLFDCLRDDTFTQRVKDKIQRKLSSIKLPYFIEGLVVTELNLGQMPPLIHRATKPMMDDRGLWIDLDITYDGLVVLILQTKLNLMKLKQPHPHASIRDLHHSCYCADADKPTDKPAMFHSDVEDSAESTSDEEAICPFQNNQYPAALDASGVPVQGLGGTSNTSKKFIKMVDKIAESKFFQAATENKYIKRAMEEVSNTELGLKVDVKELVGTLVLNVPPPPSDRVWVGFRPTPTLALTAHPIVGERNITFLRITSWIEKKLLLEFQKLMVIPNMEDFIVPVMSPKLPE